jgi:hypothetical protein
VTERIAVKSPSKIATTNEQHRLERGMAQTKEQQQPERKTVQAKIKRRANFPFWITI